MSYEYENVLLLFESFDEKCQKTISSLKNELATMRVGRANPKILDKVYIKLDDDLFPLNQFANITVPEARMLVVNVWDPSQLKRVEKAIIDANLGVLPSNDGKVIRIIFPELNEERRLALVKETKKLAENTKVTLRNHRREALVKVRDFKKESSMTDDELRGYERDLDKKVNDYVFEIDKIFVQKEYEIMKI